jgi:hypothetical protein
MPKRLLKALLAVLALGLVLAASVFFGAWRSPPYYVVAKPSPASAAILPFAQYAKVSNHPRPYVVAAPGYVVFGATHTRDPADPQLTLLEEHWRALNPTVALVEGRLGFLLPGLMDPVKRLGEGGFVNALARKAGIRVYNWDLPKETLARELQTRFSAEQIALSQILNPYFSQLRFGKPASPDAFIEEYLHRAGNVGLEAGFKSAADVDRAWRKYFPTGKDWRDVSDEHALPGFLEELQALTNDLRNRQLVSAIEELRAKGERVFVVCGSSHAVCVQPALGSEGTVEDLLKHPTEPPKGPARPGPRAPESIPASEARQ